MSLPIIGRSATILVLSLFACGFLGCGGGTPTPSPTGNSAATKTNPSETPKPANGSTASPGAATVQIEGDRLAGNNEPIVMSEQKETSPFRFTEITKEAGIDFVHVSGMNENKNFPTANGSGIAIFDYDNDGKLDLYFCTATLLPVGSAKSGPNRLYKNLGDNKFSDVTDSAGVAYFGFCHGAIASDLDNDGDKDLFLCNYGANVLFKNNGDGTFTDISKSAGIDTPNWSSGGAPIDFDNDGDLDLYISNYGSWRLPDDDKFCGDPIKKVRLYCTPRSIKTVKHLLYRNNGDMTFTNVYDTAIKTLDPETGNIKPRSDGHGFGVIAADLNDDGKIDLYVANDMNPNFLFLNNGDGTFEDATESSGAAYDERGNTQSGMGTDADDVDGDGLPEIIVTNFQNEYNTLYQNLGKGTFMDSTPFFGLAADTMPWVGWGCSLSDFNNDGWPDHFVANGHVDNNRKLLDQAVDYDEPALLFANVNGKRFRLATRDVGPYFDGKHVGRGAAFGDIDNDGDIDIIVNHKDTPASVLRNDSKSSNHWICFDLQGTKSNRDAVGAKILVETDTLKIHRQRKGGCSMMSTSDPRVLVGVGPVAEVAKVTIKWPSGKISTMEHVKVDQTLKVVEP